MIDIDKFKAINDVYGHPLGDKVIKLVTKTIGEFFGEEAVLGRLGGEEFAIVYNSHSFETVIQEVESMRNAVEMLDIIADNGDLVKCTISGGIAEVGDNMITLDQLLKEADIALYEAKGSGRNRSIFRS